MLSLTKSKSFWFQQFYIFTLSSYTYFPFISWFTIVENLFGGSKSLWSKHFANRWWTVRTHIFWSLIILSKMSFWSFWAWCHFDYFEQHFILSNISFWATFHFDHFEQILVLVIVSKFSFAKWSPNPQCCSSHRFGGKAGIILHWIAAKNAL